MEWLETSSLRSIIADGMTEEKVYFEDFDLGNEVLDSLEAMGFESPTPIQVEAIPPILEGRDLLACAQTGTGKTGAFLIPILQRVLDSVERGFINTLVIVPTRELAVQIDQQLSGLAYYAPVSSLAVYGGGDGKGFDTQKSALKDGADIVVGTPGRLITHIDLGYVDLSKVKHLVLDEADRMLDMGFSDDIKKIVSKVPSERQTLLFSATMPNHIRDLTHRMQKDPVLISLAVSKPAEKVKQLAYLAHDDQKNSIIKHVIKSHKNLQSAIVFCSRKSIVDQLTRDLRKLGLNAKAIHSNLDQEEREQVLLDFRSHKVNIMVATDILSRGIDIKGIDMVVNYDVPRDAEDYVHRIGRTARADADGTAITLINSKDQRAFHQIERLIEQVVEKAANPPGIGDGPSYNPVDRPKKKPFKKRR